MRGGGATWKQQLRDGPRAGRHTSAGGKTEGVYVRESQREKGEGETG